VANGIYDADAVDYAFKNSGIKDLSLHERAVNEMLGITAGPETDPAYENAVEILECYQPEEPLKYLVLMNRASFVNKNPCYLPYMHGEIPIGMLRNVWVPGRAFGISELQQTEQLYEEENVMRNMRVARTILETLPAFQYAAMLGIPEIRQKIAPGAFIPLQNVDQIKPLIPYSATHAFNEMKMTSEDIDDTNATYASVRGAPAMVNRVSATEAQGRNQQALTRIKLQAVVAESDLQTFPSQALALWYQKGGKETIVNVGGRNPFASIPRDAILEALEADYRFRGATQTLNKDRAIEQLMGIFEKGAPMMTPPELRETLRMVVQVMGTKGVNKLLTSEGDKYYRNLYEIKAITTEMEAKQAKMSAAMGLVQPPQEVSANVASSLEGELEGPGPGEPPPGGPSGAPPAGPPPGAPAGGPPNGGMQ
jgi:hypothetical protein